ncbi:hypothetical protein DL96DRAFT_1623858 [Flagelloscypha sp. PMI_526]|nr:hypothetical protein DL96DRAFT_1623858 [Flagelloscypha sp. PMI_526]
MSSSARSSNSKVRPKGEKKDIKSIRTKALSSSASQRVKSGLLKQLVQNAPIEIMLEIFSFVEPEDLLALSRTSRAIRRLLVNRDRLWARARKGIPMPMKPDDLPELRFTRLFFDATCMACAVTKATSFSYGRKWCKECIDSEVFHPWQWQSAMSGNDEHTFTNFGFTEAQVESLLPGYRLDLGVGPIVHFRSETRQMLDKLISSRVLEDGDMKEWFQGQLDAKERKEKFVIQCNTWEAGEKYRKEMMRFAEIKERLYALTWKETLTEVFEDYELQSTFRNIPGVQSSARLTDREWMALQPKLIAFLEHVRARRLAIQTKVRRTRRLDALSRSRKTYRKTISPDVILPPLIDLALLPPFLEAIECEDQMDTSQVQATFDCLFQEHFPKLSDEWLRSIHERLLLTEGDQTEQHPISVLRLAGTSISCGTCKRINLLYPQVLYHPCGVEYYQETLYHKTHVSSTVLSPERGIRDCLHHIQPNHQRALVLNLDTNSRASSLIELCGLDPLTATYQDLMVRNPLYECMKCTKKTTRFIMNFPAAVDATHQRGYRACRASLDHFRLVTDADCTAIGIDETIYPHTPASLTGPVGPWIGSNGQLQCRHCENEEGWIDAIVRHIVSAHNVSSPMEGVDWMMDHEDMKNGWASWCQQFKFKAT